MYFKSFSLFYLGNLNNKIVLQDDYLEEASKHMLIEKNQNKYFGSFNVLSSNISKFQENQ